MNLNLANLLAALAILAVLAVSLAPMAAETGAAVALEQGAEQLALDLQAVRQLAVAQKLTYYVYFERSLRSYVIKEANFSAPARRIYLPAQVDWSCPFQELVFYGSGRCSQGGTITLYHQELGQQIDIVIATRTGRVQVKRGE